MARRIIGAAFVSLDGIVQAPGGVDEDRSDGFAHGGWLAPVSDEAIEEGIGALFEGDFALLLGRRTYEIFAAYWPFAAMDDPIAARFARAEKFVVSHHELKSGWDGCHRLPDLDALAEVRRGKGPDLVIQGSSTLYPPLLARGLIDRLVLMIAPVLLGSGKRLFGDGTPPLTLRLVDRQIGSGGCIRATYEPAGAVAYAPSGPEIFNELERDRRDRIDKGTW